MTTRNHRIRFCANNLAAGSGAAVTGSSAHASYPLTNAVDTRRWKVWRTTGNFTITSANNNLWLNDGTNIQVSVPVGNYATGTLLAAAIQTAISLTSANWTCTYSTTTYKFTLGRTSGTANLLLATTTAAIWSTIGFTGTTTTATSTALAADEVRVHTNEYVTVDLGVAQTVEFFALVGQLGVQFGIGGGATVKLYGNHTDSWDAPAFTQTLAVDTHGIYQFLDATTDTSYRYWRFEVIDKYNANGPTLDFSYLYLGTYDTVTQSNVSNGFQKRLVDTSVSSVSEGGTSYFSTGVKYQTWAQAEVANMLAADRRTLEQTFYTVGLTQPLFVSFDPTLASSLESGEYTAWVYFQDTPTFTQLRKDVYAVSLAFREVI